LLTNKARALVPSARSDRKCSEYLPFGKFEDFEGIDGTNTSPLTDWRDQTAGSKNRSLRGKAVASVLVNRKREDYTRLELEQHVSSASTRRESKGVDWPRSMSASEERIEERRIGWNNHVAIWW
jgi:hypothetical protein